jgi:transcriptional regulator with XRE-family HTH domain
MSYHPINDALRAWLSSTAQARNTLGLSQLEVARMLGLGQAFLSGVETGNSYRGVSVSSETVEKLRSLALVLDHPLPAEYANDVDLEVISRSFERPYTPRTLEKPRRKRRKHLPPGSRVGVALMSLVNTLSADGKLDPEVAQQLREVATLA